MKLDAPAPSSPRPTIPTPVMRESAVTITQTPQQSTPVPWEDALSIGILMAKIPISAAEKLLHYWNGFQIREMPKGAIRKTLTAYFDRGDQFITRVLRDAPYLALMFDGGKSQCLGLHELVPIVVAPPYQFVLPVLTGQDGKTYSADNMASDLATTLTAFGIDLTKLKFVITDGASVNHMTNEALQEVRDLIAVTMLIDPQALGELSSDFEQTAQWWNGVQTVLRENFRQMKEIVCRAHLAKTRVDHVTSVEKWRDTEAFAFVRGVAFVFQGSANHARRRRFRAFVANKDATEKRDTVTELQDVTSAAQKLLRRCEAPVPILENSLNKLIDDIRNAAVRRTKETVSHFLEQIAKKPSDIKQHVTLLLQELEEENHAESHHEAMAFVNDTRWHSSVYASYKFVLERFSLIIAFFQTEQSVPESVATLLELASSPEKVSTIKSQLVDYLEVFSPVANYINAIADTEPAPYAISVHERFVKQQCKNEAANDAHPVRQALAAALLHEWESYESKFGAAFDIFEAIMHLSPVLLDDCEQRMTHREFVKATEMPFEEKEWLDYICLAKQETLIEANPLRWWERHKELFPELYPIAFFLLQLPTVVTRCDAVLSVESELFTVQQNRLDRKFAGRLLQWSCNGDFAQRYGGTRGHWGTYGNEK